MPCQWRPDGASERSSRTYLAEAGALGVSGQQSPTFLAPGTSFMEDSFSTEWGEGWFQNDSSILHLLCTLFPSLLYQLHLRSAGLRSQGGYMLSNVLKLLQPPGLEPRLFAFPAPPPPPVLRTPSGSRPGLSGLRRLETCQVKILRKLPPARVILAQACHCPRAVGAQPRARCWGGRCGVARCGLAALLFLLLT